SGHGRLADARVSSHQVPDYGRVYRPMSGAPTRAMRPTSSAASPAMDLRRPAKFESIAARKVRGLPWTLTIRPAMGLGSRVLLQMAHDQLFLLLVLRRPLEPFSHFPIRTAAAILLQDKARRAPCSSAA